MIQAFLVSLYLHKNQSIKTNAHQVVDAVKPNDMKKVLVLCTGNSCRSQIAHGYLKKFAGDKAEIYSAGVETHGVNPKAIATMQEDGIDISMHTSNNVNEYRDIDFDYVITVCDHAKEVCPYFPSNAALFHYNFPDPAKAALISSTKVAGPP